MVGGRDAVDKNRRASIVTVRVSCGGARHASSSARRQVPEWQVVYSRLLCHQTDANSSAWVAMMSPQRCIHTYSFDQNTATTNSTTISTPSHHRFRNSHYF